MTDLWRKKGRFGTSRDHLLKTRKRLQGWLYKLFRTSRNHSQSAVPQVKMVLLCVGGPSFFPFGLESDKWFPKGKLMACFQQSRNRLKGTLKQLVSRLYSRNKKKNECRYIADITRINSYCNEEEERSAGYSRSPRQKKSCTATVTMP